MIPKLVIFDMDGTLVDSMPTLTQMAVTLIASVYRIPESLALREYLRTVGDPFRTQLDRVFGEHDARNGVTAIEYEQDHILRASKFALGPHTVPVLATLKIGGIRTALVSSTHKKIIVTMPQVLALDFDYIAGYAGGRDKSVQICMAGAYCQTLPEDTLYVGDSVSDQAIAGMLGIAFLLADVNTLGERMIPIFGSISIQDRDSSFLLREGGEPRETRMTGDGGYGT